MVLCEQGVCSMANSYQTTKVLRRVLSLSLGFIIGACLCWAILHDRPADRVESTKRRKALQHAITYLEAYGVYGNRQWLRNTSEDVGRLYGDYSIKTQDSDKSLKNYDKLVLQLKSAFEGSDASPARTAFGTVQMQEGRVPVRIIGCDLSAVEQKLIGGLGIAYWTSEKGPNRSKCVQTDSVPGVILNASDWGESEFVLRKTIGSIVQISVLSTENGRTVMRKAEFQIRGFYNSRLSIANQTAYIPFESLCSMTGQKFDECEELWVWMDTKSTRSNETDQQRLVSEVVRDYCDDVDDSGQEIRVTGVEQRFTRFFEPRMKGLEGVRETIDALSGELAGGTYEER